MSDLEGVVAAVCSSAYPATFLPASVAKARFELRLTTEVHRERIIIPKQQNRCVEKLATPFAGEDCFPLVRLPKCQELRFNPLLKLADIHV